MKPVWDDTLDAPIGPDGSAVLVGHIASRTQAERWQAMGYDIAQAVDRYVAFLGEWESATETVDAERIVDRFYRDELSLVKPLGIGPGDPDQFRLATAAKHHEWA